MTEFSSFTTTWQAFNSGEVTPQQLEEATSIQFGCVREHLFPEQSTFDAIGETLPMEVSWVGGMRWFSCHRIPRTIVPDTIANKFYEFQKIILRLDRENKVTFSIREIGSAHRESMWREFAKVFPDQYDDHYGRVDRVWEGASSVYPVGAFVFWGDRLVTIKVQEGADAPGRAEVTYHDPRDGRVNRWVDVVELRPFG